MYKVIASISESDTPLVFKGGLITKLILSENNIDKIERMTKDIDASWTGKPPKMQDMVGMTAEVRGKKAVRKYLTIPAWLNTFAEKK